MILPKYLYNGASALVSLHDIHLRSFYQTWKKAKELAVKLPETPDPDYVSIDTLLFHVLRSARGYILWMCEKLNLDPPDINPLPTLEEVVENPELFLEHILKGWQLPLANVEEKYFFNTVYKSNWGVDYCIEAMLEHAVMHPIRHEFQLKKLMNT